MASKDFDVDMLANYLHVTPSQVERLATRGKLPGRKVGGEWRFAEAEIHHWMEKRIGLADEEELVSVEGTLSRQARSAGIESPTLQGRLRPETIAVPLLAKTKNAVVDAMVDLVAQTGLLWDPQKMADAVRAREELYSTALDIGVALLHPRRPQATILAEPVLGLGITSHGIPFGGGKLLTDVFFLICSTDERSHLQILARISRVIAYPSLLTNLRRATNAVEVYQILCETEDEIIT